MGSVISALPNAIDVHVGNRAQRVRMFRNISLFQLAHRLKITPEQLARYEAGSQRFPAECLMRLCDVLGMTSSFLFADACGPRYPSINELENTSTHYVNDNYFRNACNGASSQL
jgi:transcriptional regulator with XRE-family HTH domain